MGKRLKRLKKIAGSMASDVKREARAITTQYGKAKKSVAKTRKKYKRFRKKMRKAERSGGKALDQLAKWGENFSKNIEREFGSMGTGGERVAKKRKRSRRRKRR